MISIVSKLSSRGTLRRGNLVVHGCAVSFATGWLRLCSPRSNVSLLKRAAALSALAFLFVVATAALAGEAAPAADDPALEKRVNALASELRCLVCQNQSIADSNAGLAIDLKNQVREKLKQGESEAQIVGFMVERYGDFVLYRPPLKGSTLMLWFGPPLLLIAGLAVLYRRTRRAAPEGETELTAAERERAARLLATGNGSEAR
jgi:cytochrome c-type biogenesis protein CcmH